MPRKHAFLFMTYEKADSSIPPGEPGVCLLGHDMLNLAAANGYNRRGNSKT